MQGFVSDGSKAGAIGSRGSIAATRRHTSTLLPWHREDVFKPGGSMLTRRLRRWVAASLGGVAASRAFCEQEVVKITSVKQFLHVLWPSFSRTAPFCALFANRAIDRGAQSGKVHVPHLV
jgi:hypothetical protein